MTDDKEKKKRKFRVITPDSPPLREVKRRTPEGLGLPFKLPEPPEDDDDEVDLLEDPDQPVPVANLLLPLRLQMEIVDRRGEAQGSFEPTFSLLQLWFREHNLEPVHIGELDRLRFLREMLDNLVTAIDLAVEGGHKMPEDLTQVWNNVTKSLEEAGETMPFGNGQEDDEDDECDD